MGEGEGGARKHDVGEGNEERESIVGEGKDTPEAKCCAPAFPPAH